MAEQDIEKLVTDRLDQYGARIVDRIRERLLEADKLATGDLYNSVTYGVTADNGIATLTIYANDYFEWVDQGRMPNRKQPPLENILTWVRNRGIRPRNPGIRPRSQNLDRTDRSLAFLIARKIGIDGIKATNIMQPTLQEINDPLLQDINGLIAQAIIDIIGADLEDIAMQVNNDVLQMTINYLNR